MQVGFLVPLESLLEHDSMRVQTYANATLYSLLREPDIRYPAPLPRQESGAASRYTEYGYDT